jgi:GT2 family glycosyltransferase
MSQQVTVSVVIVSWNARQFLAQCLHSLDRRTCQYDMEIIVVDNGSTDGSPEMVQKDFPHCRLICNHANLGFAKANNIGIRQSAGKYVCLVNSDVRVLDGCITRLVDFCDAHPEVGMVGPRIQGGDGNLQPSCRGFPTVWNTLTRALGLDALFPQSTLFGGYLLPHWKHDTLKPVDILSGCFWLVRRQALDTVGLLDEAFFIYGEDMDWCKRFWAHDWRLIFVPTAQAIHYGAASSDNAPIRFYLERQRADLQYWRKHHGWCAQQCYYLISCLQHLLRIIGYACALLAPGGDRSRRRLKVARSVRCMQWLLSPHNFLRLTSLFLVLGSFLLADGYLV